MAWSATVDTTTDDAAGDLSPSRLKVDMLDGDNESDGVAEQVEAARLAAKDIVKRGAVGEGRIRIILTGHANPAHRQPTRDTVKEYDRAPDRVVVSVQRYDEIDR